jgi:DNA-binding transcriptional LysR family regulator
VAQLEARLGVRLLMRSTHGLTPTEAGQSFYERAKRSIEEADEAEAVARGAGKGLIGRLRISRRYLCAAAHRAAPAGVPGGAPRSHNGCGA